MSNSLVIGYIQYIENKLIEPARHRTKNRTYSYLLKCHFYYQKKAFSVLIVMLDLTFSQFQFLYFKKKFYSKKNLAPIS